MPLMRGLTIVVVSCDPGRWDAALTLASAEAALGGRTRVYCHDAAVTLIAPSDLLATARELGVTLIACQTGLATHGMALPEGVEGGGLVSLLAELDDDRLVTI
ncbi:DsrE family protein [Sphingomonas sp.]|uniref:DsrE family protein n=1 Tax=Sphingomonas sp. TaxID=28214 RepID=UPI002C713A3D|nr:DsrE family protein [Sphingomonas sp.]HWK35834.1 DsrE family protein [Sphingomonas sp.]